MDSYGLIKTYGDLPRHYVIISKTGENAFHCTCSENPINADGECIHIACGKDIVHEIEIVDEALLYKRDLSWRQTNFGEFITVTLIHLEFLE